ncbi:MAG: lactonase family protein [Planctomycetota bacterium]
MPPATFLLFVSMFAAGEKGGVQAFHLDSKTGEIASRTLTTGVENPFFLALSPDRQTLYSIHAKKFGSADNEEVAAYRILNHEGELKLLNRQSARGSAACFLDIDSTGHTLLVANYSTGSVASLPIAADGSLGEVASFCQHTGSSVNASRQKEPHAHSIVKSPDNRFAYAADLGTDRILCYRLDPTTATLTPNDPPFGTSPAGAGPRHLAFHTNARYLYAINELTNSVSVFAYDAKTGALSEQQTISTLPPDFTGTSYCADLKISPDGRFLYGTNRGHDSIAIFRIGDDAQLTNVQIVPSRGKGPQNIALTPDGSLLLCANMPGNNLSLFRVDRSSGTLQPIGEPTAIPSPACIVLVPVK